MPFNLLKKYPELLEVGHLEPKDRMKSLRGVFDRDISNNLNFKFRNKQIHPTKQDGVDPLDILFEHLTTETEIKDDGKKTGRRFYEQHRSVRLHWIRFHIEEKLPAHLKIFSFKDRVDRTDSIRTYIFDKKEKYVIILEPLRSGDAYYLLTAYHLNKSYGLKQIKKKYKKRLDILH